MIFPPGPNCPRFLLDFILRPGNLMDVQRKYGAGLIAHVCVLLCHRVSINVLRSRTSVINPLQILQKQDAGWP